MGIRCHWSPDPGRSAPRNGPARRVWGMTTTGLRGIFAAVLMVSTGLLTGMASMPSGAAAGESTGHAGAGAEAPGLVERFKRRACEISLVATRRDLGSARERSQECAG